MGNTAKCRHYKRWTIDEDNFLKDNYSDYTTKKLAKMLNRTESSISCRVHFLNISKGKWSVKEDDIIKKYYSKGGYIECKKMGLSVSKEAIHSRASYLGVKKGRTYTKWSDEDIEYLSKNYSELSFEELVVNLGRSRSTIIAKANVLGLKKRNNWTIEEDNLITLYYPDTTIEDLQSKGVKHSEYAIQQRASYLGVRKRCESNDWTTTELKLLKDSYATTTIKELQNMGLAKSTSAIKNMVERLGLRKNDCRVWSEDELNILRTYYTEGGYLLCSLKGLNRPMHTVYRKAHSLGIRYKGRLKDIGIKVG